MAMMGPEATFKHRRTSQAHPQHPIFPDLLTKMQIGRANQVWCAAIIFAPMRERVLYLSATMDWASCIKRDPQGTEII